MAYPMRNPFLVILAFSTQLGVACSSTNHDGSSERHDVSGGRGAGGSMGTGGSGGIIPTSSARATGGAFVKESASTLGGAGTGGRATGGSATITAGGTGGTARGDGGASPYGSSSSGVATGGVTVTATVSSSSATGGVGTMGTATGGIATGGVTTIQILSSRTAAGGLTAGGSGSLTGGTANGGFSSGGTTATTGAGGATTVRLEWTNPIVPKRADPYVFLHSDGYYYLTATVPEYDRIEMRRATTLGGLSTAQVTTVWRKHTSGEMGAHIWAPEIHYIDGAWHIYFTAGRADDIWAIRMYALKNTSANPLEGTWTELGQIVTNWDSFSLDATTFSHAGQRYYLWTQRVPDYTGTSILISRMSAPSKLTGAQVVLSWPEYDWEKQGEVVNEAPAALVKNGKIFITYSASATGSSYCMGLLTADATADLLDRKSWTKATQPVFQSNSKNSQYGPGHNSFTTTQDGRIDILVYHARSYRDITGDPLNNPDRATRAQYLPFDAAGLPVFGVPVADGAYQVDVLL